MKQRGGSPRPDPTAIGTVATPPFVRLPDPVQLFANRASRFRQHAPGNPLKPYLELLAGLSDLQASVQEGLPEPALPAADLLARAASNAMPPLNRSDFRPNEDFDALFDRLTEGAKSLDMPDEARAALERLAGADRGNRDRMLSNVLADAIPVEALAEHVFVAAAVQVHFARLAALLDPASLKPVGDGVCPACGGAPVSSAIVDWPDAHGTRFCTCSTCATMWNYVRAKCTLCGSTKDISFREVDGAGGTVKAEICGSCRGYVKVLYQDRDPALDPVADDVATLGLDILVKELGYRRGGVNPFLVGY